MQILSDSQFQYTINQNQFQNNYDGRKTLSFDIKKIFVVLSRILARENTVFCMASDRIILEPPVFFYDLFPLISYPVQRYNKRKQIMMQTI